MENRRDFFKYLGTFAAGVVGAKIASYTPKKEETKEELMVSDTITIYHEGKEYHPVVVAKNEDSSSMAFADKDTNREVMRIKPDGSTILNGFHPPKRTIRKINV